MARGDGLELTFDPFEEKGLYIGQPVQQALARVFDGIEQGARCILIAGKPGTGKTFLLSLIERDCAAKGISTCRFDRGDLADSLSAPVRILLVDEAESLSPSTVQRFTDTHCTAHARTAILACVEPTPLHSTIVPIIVELGPLDGAQAKTCLSEQAAAAGRPDLFAAGALDLIVESASGLPRLLMSTAKLALFCARLDGASQVDRRHVSEALRVQMRMPAERQTSTPIPDPIVATTATFSGPSLAERAATQNLSPSRRQRWSGLAFALITTRTNGLFQRVDASTGEGAALASAVFLGGFVIPWLLSAEPVLTASVPVLPVNVAHNLPHVTSKELSVASAVDAEFVAPAIGLAPVAKTKQASLARNAGSNGVAIADKAPARRNAEVTERQTRPNRPAVAAAQRTARIEGQASSRKRAKKRELAGLPVKQLSAPIVSMPLTLVPSAPPESVVVSDDRQFLIDVTRASRATLVEAWTASARREPSSRNGVLPMEPNSMMAGDGPALESGALGAAAAGVDSVKAPRAAEPSVLRPEDVRPTTSEAARDRGVTESILPARAASEQVSAALEVVRTAAGAKDATDLAKFARESAQTANAAKETVEQIKIVRGALDGAKAAKDAADIARAAKDSVAMAKAAKEILDGAKAAKDAADIAKAAKDSVAMAKAAKEALDGARAAKDAADIAKTAKESVAMAKAAKEALDGAKAAKDAADIAKTAKEAVDLAKAAKDAAKTIRDVALAARPG